MIEFKVSTILGAQLGFEIFTATDYEGAGLSASWGILINLFALRITLTKYIEDNDD